MRKRIIETTLAKPAQLKHYHPIGSAVRLIDLWVEKSGRTTWFGAPDVGNMYLNRAEEFIRFANSKRAIAFASRKSTNPMDTSQGDSFADTDSILDFFELSSAAITLLYAAVEHTVNRLIGRMPKLHYQKMRYITILKVAGIRIQIKKKKIVTVEEALALPLREKLNSLLPTQCNFLPPHSQHFWPEFIFLEKLRHGLIHVTQERAYGAGRQKNLVFAQLLEVDLDKLLKNAEALVQYINTNLQ